MLLQGAAKREDGPRAFLELGGAELVFDAVRRAAAGRIAYGVRLDKALGENRMRGLPARCSAHCERGSEGRTLRPVHPRRNPGRSSRSASTPRKASCWLSFFAISASRGRSRDGRNSLRAAGLPPSAAERKSLAAASQANGGQVRSSDHRPRREIVARELAAASALLSLIDQVENATDSFDEAAFLSVLRRKTMRADGLGRAACRARPDREGLRRPSGERGRSRPPDSRAAQG